jgi:hypothetical protein
VISARRDSASVAGMVRSGDSIQPILSAQSKPPLPTRSV